MHFFFFFGFIAKAIPKEELQQVLSKVCLTDEHKAFHPRETTAKVNTYLCRKDIAAMLPKI